MRSHPARPIRPGPPPALDRPTVGGSPRFVAERTACRGRPRQPTRAEGPDPRHPAGTHDILIEKPVTNLLFRFQNMHYSR